MLFKPNGGTSVKSDCRKIISPGVFNKLVSKAPVVDSSILYRPPTPATSHFIPLHPAISRVLKPNAAKQLAGILLLYIQLIKL